MPRVWCRIGSRGRRRELIFVDFGDEQRQIAERLSPAPLAIDVVELNLEDAFIEYTRGPKRSIPIFVEDEVHVRRRSRLKSCAKTPALASWRPVRRLSPSCRTPGATSWPSSGAMSRRFPFSIPASRIGSPGSVSPSPLCWDFGKPPGNRSAERPSFCCIDRSITASFTRRKSPSAWRCCSL